MALSVIGAGFGRTGTLSLKRALERLGFDPCYHMVEWLENEHHTTHWRPALTQGSTDWDALFSGYRAAVDFPVCGFYRALSAHYPDAKFILTTRDPDAWYESARSTIHANTVKWLEEGGQPAPAVERLRLVDEAVWQRMFGGRFEDRAHAKAVFEKHNRDVMAHIPAHRLLVYQAGDGWEPLCGFLGVEVPDEPYPHVNTRTEFLTRGEHH